MRSPGSWNVDRRRPRHRRPPAASTPTAHPPARAAGPSLTRALSTTLLVLAQAGACAHEATPPTRSVAILPVDTLGVPPAEGAMLKAAVERQVERSGTAHILPPERSDLALTLTLAGLGDVRLVRSQLVHNGDRLVLQDLKDTVPAGTPAMDAYAVDLARRLFPEAARRPWYRQGWWWSIAGAAAVAAAATTWALSRGGPDSGGVTHLGNL